MPRGVRLAVVVAAAAVLAIAGWLLLRPRGATPPKPAGIATPAPTPARFAADRVELAPGGAAVHVGRLYTSPEPEGTWWEFVAVCQQVSGCRGEYEFVIDFRSAGATRQISHRRELDLPSLGQVKVAWVERGRYSVESVDRITVRAPAPPTGPAATPAPRRSAY